MNKIYFGEVKEKKQSKWQGIAGCASPGAIKTGIRHVHRCTES